MPSPARLSSKASNPILAVTSLNEQIFHVTCVRAARVRARVCKCVCAIVEVWLEYQDGLVNFQSPSHLIFVIFFAAGYKKSTPNKQAVVKR